MIAPDYTRPDPNRWPIGILGFDGGWYRFGDGIRAIPGRPDTVAVSGHSVIMRCAVCPRHRDRKRFCALFTPQAVGITPDIDHGRMVQDQNGRSQHGDPKDLAAFAEALFEVRIRPARS